MAAPKLEGTPIISLEVAPLAISKCFQVSKARASSSTPQSVTFEEVLGDPILGSKIFMFKNWKVTKGVFENFIHLVNVE